MPAVDRRAADFSSLIRELFPASTPAKLTIGDTTARSAAAYKMKEMSLDDYKVLLYRNQPSGWVAEVPSIPGCHALMPTREDALTELVAVFQMISEEYAERKEILPADTTEIAHA